MAATLYSVKAGAGGSDLRPLQTTTRKTVLRLAPGQWTATVIGVGLAEEVISFGADTVRIALAVGAPLKADAKMTQKASGDESADIARKLPRPSVRFTVKAGATTMISAAAVLDRGTPPEMLTEIRNQLLEKVPDGATPVAIAAMLGGAFADLGIALAVAAFTKAADSIIKHMFGRDAILLGARPIKGAASGATSARLCLTQLPDPRAVNVGHVPGPNDYRVTASGALIETQRQQAIGREEVPEHPGHIPSVESYLVVQLTRQAAASTPVVKPEAAPDAAPEAG